MTNRLAVNTVEDELEAAADFCRTEGVGLEVTDFAFPRNLGPDMAEKVERCRRAVAGIALLSVHGPFLELVAGSLDPAIVEVARDRHAAALRAAHQIGASFYIVHTNFNPLIRDTSYQKNFTKRMLDFWLPFADVAAEHQIVICFENIWETDPEVQAELVAGAGHPSLKATFDNGHALLFSARPARYWIETLGSGLAHCHLHDNAGTMDEHKPVGEGKENWGELIHAVGRSAPQAVLVAESDRVERNRVSLERLRNLQQERASI